jgi:short subunit dehydrogenase-like uncharacterized protein
MKKNLMIYGATGYSGKLIAEASKARGMAPILAGRSEEKVRAVADRLGLQYRAFDLSDAKRIDTSIHDVDVIINSAGPFSGTSIPLVESCLRTATHYLDLSTGMADDFEKLAAYDADARKKKMMILPGIGFTLVPSDCLALYVSKKVSNPRALYMYMTGHKKMSRGTLKTAIEHINKGVCIRKNGTIVRRDRLAVRKADLGNGMTKCISTPLGDISTAYHTTGIENIEVFFELSPGTRMFVYMIHYLGWFYGTGFMQRMLMKYAEKQPEGPSEKERNSDRSVFVATVEGRNGTTASARLTTPEGYKLTCLTALLIAEKVLKGKIKTGYTTPAQVYGPDLIMEIEGVKREDL